MFKSFLSVECLCSRVLADGKGGLGRPGPGLPRLQTQTGAPGGQCHPYNMRILNITLTTSWISPSHVSYTHGVSRDKMYFIKDSEKSIINDDIV